MPGYSKLTIYFLLLITTAYAQEIRVIDNKGTLKQYKITKLPQAQQRPQKVLLAMFGLIPLHLVSYQKYMIIL